MKKKCTLILGSAVLLFQQAASADHHPLHLATDHLHVGTAVGILALCAALALALILAYKSNRTADRVTLRAPVNGATTPATSSRHQRTKRR